MEIPKHFNKLLLELGTTKEIAEALDVSVQTVYAWAKHDRVPTRYLKKIQQITQGRINPIDLRPDLIPDFNKVGFIQSTRFNASFDEGEEELINHKEST